MNTLKLDATPVDSGSAPVAPVTTVAPTISTAQTIANDATAVISAAAPFAALAGPYGQAAVVIATGALAIYKAVLPGIQDLINKGMVSAVDQAILNAAFEDVAHTHATAFQGPEWKQD